ncbi:COG3650 family protein [Thalassococcus sp. BH17M4-6]|uniref:COG3650 family protein n=1 Tax=Thalassococcus sp. BH17M4-6 TaxID=3413148 RepID=UPI003BD629D1
MIRALVLWLMLALPVAAQDFRLPAVFDVAGVAGDDVLNVREGPSGDAAILGSLAPDARGVEVTVLDDTGRWGRVNLGEQAGWVSMAYLQAQGPGDGSLPQTLACFGTEPFWRLDVAQGGQSVFEEAGQEPLNFETGAAIAAAGRTDVMAVTGPDITVVLRRAACNDGMSDRGYGLWADVILSNEALFSGCCSVSQQ